MRQISADSALGGREAGECVKNCDLKFALSPFAPAGYQSCSNERHPAAQAGRCARFDCHPRELDTGLVRDLGSADGYSPIDGAIDVIAAGRNANRE